MSLTDPGFYRASTDEEIKNEELAIASWRRERFILFLLFLVGVGVSGFIAWRLVL